MLTFKDTSSDKRPQTNVLRQMSEDEPWTDEVSWAPETPVIRSSSGERSDLPGKVNRSCQGQALDSFTRP